MLLTEIFEEPIIWGVLERALAAGKPVRLQCKNFEGELLAVNRLGLDNGIAVVPRNTSDEHQAPILKLRFYGIVARDTRVGYKDRALFVGTDKLYRLSNEDGVLVLRDREQKVVKESADEPLIVSLSNKLLTKGEKITYYAIEYLPNTTNFFKLVVNGVVTSIEPDEQEIKIYFKSLLGNTRSVNMRSKYIDAMTLKKNEDDEWVLTSNVWVTSPKWKKFLAMGLTPST